MRFEYCSIIVAALVASACQQQAEQPRQTESGAANYGVEKNPPQTNIVPPTEVEMQALLVLQDRIVQQPYEIALRRQLGEKAINTSAGVVWTVGRGKFPAGASASAVAKNQAELAARIDASRWAAYLLEWHKNDYLTNYGSIQAQVPGSEVASTLYSDSTCVVLVKTSFR